MRRRALRHKRVASDVISGKQSVCCDRVAKYFYLGRRRGHIEAVLDCRDTVGSQGDVRNFMKEAEELARGAVAAVDTDDRRGIKRERETTHILLIDLPYDENQDASVLDLGSPPFECLGGARPRFGQAYRSAKPCPDAGCNRRWGIT
jgi:hypothetical protein